MARISRRTIKQVQKQAYDDFASRPSAKLSVHHTPKTSVYSVPFHLQIWALMQRQFLIKWQDKFSLTVSWITSIAHCNHRTGTVWLNQPENICRCFHSRWCSFLSLLFNAFQAFAELASTMMGRPIVNKHRAYTFHRPECTLASADSRRHGLRRDPNICVQCHRVFHDRPGSNAGSILYFCARHRHRILVDDHFLPDDWLLYARTSTMRSSLQR